MRKKIGKIFAFFAEFKLTFDKIGHGYVNETMRKVKIVNNLRQKIMRNYVDKKNIVKVGDTREIGVFNWKRSKTGVFIVFNII